MIKRRVAGLMLLWAAVALQAQEPTARERPDRGPIPQQVAPAVGGADDDGLLEEERFVEQHAGKSPVVEATVAQKFPADDAVGVIGDVSFVQSAYHDTLVDIGRLHGLGYEEIRIANPGIDAWLPGEGTSIRLPTEFVLPDAKRSGLVINIAEYRMYYFFEQAEQRYVMTFPISIGRMDWGTPLGRSAVVKKVQDPSWYPPQSIRDEWAADGRKLAARVPPGPDNPLGRYAMRLSIPGYLIHGTNRPAGVGMRVTHGCIRMFPEDIEYLFPNVPVNTAVQIVNQPYKFGWRGDDLYLEVHPPLEARLPEDAQNDVPDEDPAATSAPPSASLTPVVERYIRATRDREADVDWALVDEVYEQHLGIPVRVGRARGVGPTQVSTQ